MAKLPYFPLWTDAYLADTTHLTAIQHGAHLLLMMVAWRTPTCSLPNDPTLLARYARMSPKEWGKHSGVVLSLWKLNISGEWYQARLKKEFAHAHELYDAKSRAGRANALKKKETGSPSVVPVLQQDGIIADQNQNQNQNHNQNQSFAEREGPGERAVEQQQLGKGDLVHVDDEVPHERWFNVAKKLQLTAEEAEKEYNGFRTQFRTDNPSGTVMPIKKWEAWVSGSPYHRATSTCG